MVVTLSSRFDLQLLVEQQHMVVVAVVRVYYVRDQVQNVGPVGNRPVSTPNVPNKLLRRSRLPRL